MVGDKQVRKGELDCIHGIGHSANNHGCDGCCFVLGVYERERIIKLLKGMRTGYMFQDAQCEYDAIGDAIALIKGENK